MKTTITEALAELKTIDKRTEKKLSFVSTYMVRLEAIKDPHAKQGGSDKLVGEALQSIKDLYNRKIEIRMAIQRVNQSTPITVEGITRPIAEWLTWKKEIAPELQKNYRTLQQKIDQARAQAQKQGGSLTKTAVDDNKPQDIVVHFDEAQLSTDAELLEKILGDLDGQLSLKNATVTIELQ